MKKNMIDAPLKIVVPLTDASITITYLADKTVMNRHKGLPPPEELRPILYKHVENYPGEATTSQLLKAAIVAHKAEKERNVTSELERNMDRIIENYGIARTAYIKWAVLFQGKYDEFRTKLTETWFFSDSESDDDDDGDDEDIGE